MSTHGPIHIDKALTNFSRKFTNGLMIGNIVCPSITVSKESDKYFRYLNRDRRVYDAQRADKTPPNFIDSWKTDTATYNTVEYSLADLVSDRERKNADKPLNPDLDTTETLTNNLLLTKEKRIADLYTAQATYNASNRVQLSGTEQWNNTSFDSDDPTDSIKARIDAGKTAIRKATGMYPNVIILPAEVALVVENDPDTRDRFKYVKNTLENSSLPPVFYGMRLLVPGGIYNADNKNSSDSETATDVWGKHAIMLYVAQNPRSIKTFSFGITFSFKTFETSRWREDSLKADAIEVCHNEDNKIVAADAGYLIEDCIS